jgi:hypothetical protein
MISDQLKHEARQYRQDMSAQQKPAYVKKPISEQLVREVHIETHINNTVKELTDLLLSKHRDYGPKNISQAPGGALNGLRVRMHDKLARINNLHEAKFEEPQYEPLEDSFKDMANYAIIGLLVLRGQWDSK